MEEFPRCRLVNNRSPRARALGKALREARLDQDLGLREFAKTLGRDPSLLSRWETGDRTPPTTDVAQILGNLHIKGKRYTEILELAEAVDEPLWLATTLPEQRAQLAALLDFERTASVITDISPLLVPGLLQTSQYTRAIMSAGFAVPPDEINTRVAIRMGRREVLTRREPARLIAYIGEAALRQRLGSPATMSEQCGHLTNMAALPNIDIRIVPFDSDWHPGLQGASLLIESEAATPVVHLEVRETSMFLHSVTDIDACRQAIATLSEQAMSPEDSLVVIALARAGWESV
jgi:transcriptional regulator with XRE-family HTH domain